MHLSIGDHYFSFHPPVDHTIECPLSGTNMWETALLRRDHSVLAPDGSRDETVIRLLCRKCGVVHLQTFVGGGDSWEFTHVSKIGYGATPQRSCGLWLHPGPLFAIFTEDRGPEAFYITGGDEPPTSPEDVFGVIGWKTGPRGGVRWWAGQGLREGKYGCHVERSAEGDFRSRQAAVQWVVDAHAEAYAKVPAEAAEMTR